MRYPRDLLHFEKAGPNFMALLTVSRKSALTGAGNSAFTLSVFHRLAGNAISLITKEDILVKMLM